MLHVRMDTEMKRKAIAALAAMGLTASQAVRLLFHRIAVDQAFPLELTQTGRAVPSILPGSAPMPNCSQGRIRLPSRTHLILLLLAPAAACGDDPSPPAHTPPQIADSAGIRIITYDHTPTPAAPFQLATEPRYRHGANPGDYAFQEVSGGRLLPDGSAGVYDPWNAELVVFGPDGATYEVLATEGEGPGEVSYVDAILPLERDSVLIADPGLARLTLFVGGSVARTMALPRGARLRVEGIGSSGELLLATSGGAWGFEGEWLSGRMARFDMETGALDTVASYDFWPRMPPGLEWNPIGAAGEVMVATGHFVYTRSDRAEVTWRLPDGSVTQIVRWQAEPALLTEEWLAPSEAEHRMSVRMHYPDLSDAGIAERTRSDMAAYHASIGRPLPLFGSPFADAKGRVWLPSYRPGAEHNSVPPYTVIAPDGEWLGTVEAPPRFRILDVAAGLVLGAARDDMDVESVVVYELIGG